MARSAKQRKHKDTELSQHDKFVVAARDLECDDDEGHFRERFKNLTEAPPPESVEKRKIKVKK